MISNKYKIIRIILYSVTSLFLVFVIYFLVFIDMHVERYIKNYVSSSSNGRYRLTYEDFDYNPILGTITVENLNMSLDSALFTNKEINSASKYMIQELELEGIDLFSFLITGSIRLTRVYIRKPVVEMISKEDNKPENARTSFKTFLSSDIVKNSGSGELIIYDGLLKVYKNDKKNLEIIISGLNVNIKNLEAFSIDGDTGITAEIIHIGADKYLMNQDKYYSFTGKGINIRKTSFSIDSIIVSPEMSKERFAAEKNLETDRIALTAGKINADGVDFFGILNNKSIKANKFSIGTLELIVSRVLDYPKDSSKTLGSPKEILKSIDFIINIDKLTLSSGNIIYEEIKRETGASGKVTFGRMSVEADNITNITSRTGSRRKLTIKSTAYLMNEGMMQSTIEIPLGKNSDEYFINGTIGSFDITKMNTFLENIELIRIKKGMISSGEFSVTVRGNSAKGKMLLLYDDLSINTLDYDKEEKKAEPEALTSFILNAFILEDNNPDGGEVKTGAINYTREPYRNITSYWWFSLRSGILDLIGLKNKKP